MVSRAALADLLGVELRTMPVSLRRADWWPVDKVILAYFSVAMALEIAFWSKMPGAGALLLVHCAAISPILLAVLHPDSAAARVFHHWYPLPYVFASYREMSILIPALDRSAADSALAVLDRQLWGTNPTIWLERLRSPALTETLE